MLLLAQSVVASIAQGAGYAGLLLFTIRAPANRADPAWRPLELSLPIIATVIALGLLASYASVFGHKAETITRIGILAGFAVDISALAVLFARRRKQSPEDNQRLRWVMFSTCAKL